MGILQDKTTGKTGSMSKNRKNQENRPNRNPGLLKQHACELGVNIKYHWSC